jgi:hypothetical protein
MSTGNHSLYSAYDSLIVTDLFRRRGVIVRGLADRDQLRIPLWKDILPGIGGVEGSRENCAELMRQGESVMVFPGGSREVWKRPGQRYELLWGDRLGFARMAIEHGYPIVSLSQLGGDGIYNVAFDESTEPLGPAGQSSTSSACAATTSRPSGSDGAALCCRAHRTPTSTLAPRSKPRRSPTDTKIARHWSRCATRSKPRSARASNTSDASARRAGTQGSPGPSVGS